MNLREKSSKLRDLVFRWSETRRAWFRVYGLKERRELTVEAEMLETQ